MVEKTRPTDGTIEIHYMGSMEPVAIKSPQEREAFIQATIRELNAQIVERRSLMAMSVKELAEVMPWLEQ